MRIGNAILGISALIISSLSGCATPSTPYEKGTPIAVWNLENLTPGGSPTLDLGDMMAAEVMKTLEQSEYYQVVEREQLLLALEELKLGTSALADESTGLKLGRLLGARLMLFGGYQVIEDKMRLDLRLVEVESGRVLKASQKITSSNDVSEWLRAAREATRELI